LRGLRADAGFRRQHSGPRTQIPLSHLNISHESFVTRHWSLGIGHGRVICHLPLAICHLPPAACPDRLFLYGFLTPRRQAAKNTCPDRLSLYGFLTPRRQAAKNTCPDRLFLCVFLTPRRQAAKNTCPDRLFLCGFLTPRRQAAKNTCPDRLFPCVLAALREAPLPFIPQSAIRNPHWELLEF